MEKCILFTKYVFLSFESHIIILFFKNFLDPVIFENDDIDLTDSQLCATEWTTNGDSFPEKYFFLYFIYFIYCNLSLIMILNQY